MILDTMLNFLNGDFKSWVVVIIRDTSALYLYSYDY